MADSLTERWELRWPGCRPIGHELRACASERWVRFHSLPNSKRYADTEVEDAEVLRRHNVVIGQLVGTSQPRSSNAVVVTTCSWSADDAPVDRDAGLAATDAGARYWRSERIDPDDEQWAHLWVSQRRWANRCLDPLLQLCASWSTSDVIVSSLSFGWLYHPYDGGCDVILPTAEARDRLAQEHEQWLPSHSSGL